jgi:hypothetical protein
LVTIAAVPPKLTCLNFFPCIALPLFLSDLAMFGCKFNGFTSIDAMGHLEVA